MEERISCKSLEVSDKFKKSLNDIYYYSFETFGQIQTERYMQKMEKAIDSLLHYYLAYPECRHIATKSRMYRNIILDAHLIIYRITDERIEVLDIIHSASSISRIRGVRNVRL